MRALQAIAISSSSTPPTQRTAGRSFAISRWLASSSKPHWQITRPAPESLTFLIISRKYAFSAACISSYAATVSSSSLCLVFGFGGSKGHVSTQSFTSLSSLGICGCDMSLSTTMPRTRRVSSSLPPTFESILIRSRLTSPRSWSATASTASTAISAISRCARFTILEPSVVIATSMRRSRSSLPSTVRLSKTSDTDARWSVAILAARS
mmetsp:Transcript_1343/g.3796  ORF Transcript_1343/g.3796 Transcript_1343/m.3796 type:complete len:209 (-) Transcript_1343:452-1078(-)